MCSSDLVALYRIALQGWTKEAAIREMTQGGFGYHEIWINLPPWIRDMDITALRRKAGIPMPESAKGVSK